MERGRPPMPFNQEVADYLCERIATSSRGLKAICDEDEKLPSVSTILKWLNNSDDFKLQYAHARELQADYLADEILAISDDGSNDLMTITKVDVSYETENKEVVNRSKLRVDARKWIASKLRPKKYGDKLELDGGMNTTLSITPETLEAIAAKINANGR